MLKSENVDVINMAEVKENEFGIIMNLLIITCKEMQSLAFDISAIHLILR